MRPIIVTTSTLSLLHQIGEQLIHQHIGIITTVSSSSSVLLEIGCGLLLRLLWMELLCRLELRLLRWYCRKKNDKAGDAVMDVFRLLESNAMIERDKTIRQVV